MRWLAETEQSIIRLDSFVGFSMTMARQTKASVRDFSWKFTPVIVEWERGDFGEELVEVSHEQAEKIIEYFRGRWGSAGS